MKELVTINGGITLVDDEDYDRLAQWRWSRNWRGYIVRMVRLGRRADGRQHVQQVRIHRVVLNAPAEFHVDHINGQPWDNRKANLRLCTPAQNARNLRKLTTRPTSSLYKGVSWKKSHQQWYASIRVDNRERFIGLYRSQVEAARAYDRTAIEYHGEFARLNFPDDQSA